MPDDSSNDPLELLRERLPLLTSPDIARRALPRLSSPAARLTADDLFTALRIFTTARGGRPERRLKLFGVLLHVRANLTPDDPDEALAAALCRRDEAQIAETSPGADPDAALALWADLEQFRFTAAWDDPPAAGLFAALWTQALAKTKEEALAAVNRHWLCRRSFITRVAAPLRRTNAGALATSPADGPLFAGATRLALEAGLAFCSQKSDRWHFLSPFGRAIAERFAAKRPEPGRWRSAQQGPASRRFRPMSVLGRQVLLPDALTNRTLAAFHTAFSAVDEAVRLNPSRRSFFSIKDVGLFLPDAFVAEPAELWAEFFLAAGAVAEVAPGDVNRADDASPFAVRRYDEADRCLHVGHLFLFATGDEVPLRLLCNRRALAAAFVRQETEHRPLVHKPLPPPRSIDRPARRPKPPAKDASDDQARTLEAAGVEGQLAGLARFDSVRPSRRARSRA